MGRRDLTAIINHDHENPNYFQETRYAKNVMKGVGPKLPWSSEKIQPVLFPLKESTFGSSQILESQSSVDRGQPIGFSHQ